MSKILDLSEKVYQIWDKSWIGFSYYFEVWTPFTDSTSTTRFEKLRPCQQLIRYVSCVFHSLEDLSLFGNKISVLENLDKQQKLQVLSIGNNRIDRLENVRHDK